MLADAQVAAQLFIVGALGAISYHQQLGWDLFLDLLENPDHVSSTFYFSEVGGMDQDAFVIWRNGLFKVVFRL
ncbi:hypothetical protein D3C87_1372910 [compost metagenome]